MANIYDEIHKLISPNYSLAKYSITTQGLAGSDTTILWNSDVSKIDEVVYRKFEESLKLRGSKYYTHSSSLSYTNFCIAVLSCNAYSLNHKSTPAIPARVYVAAWRSLYIIASTGDEIVKDWLKKYIVGRTASGFSAAHDVQLDNSTIPDRTRYGKNISPKALQDADILFDAIDTGKVVEIPYYSYDNNSSGVHYSTPTPECELADIKLFHDIMVDQK